MAASAISFAMFLTQLRVADFARVKQHASLSAPDMQTILKEEAIVKGNDPLDPVHFDDHIRLMMRTHSHTSDWDAEILVDMMVSIINLERSSPEKRTLTCAQATDFLFLQTKWRIDDEWNAARARGVNDLASAVAPLVACASDASYDSTCTALATLAAKCPQQSVDDLLSARQEIFRGYIPAIPSGNDYTPEFGSRDVADFAEQRREIAEEVEGTEDDENRESGDATQAGAAADDDQASSNEATTAETETAVAQEQVPVEERSAAVQEVEDGSDDENDEDGDALEAKAVLADDDQATAMELDALAAQKEAPTEETPEVVEEPTDDSKSDFGGDMVAAKSAEEGPEDVKEVEAANTGDTVQDDEDPANAVELDSSAVQEEAPTEEMPEVVDEETEDSGSEEGGDVVEAEAAIAGEEANPMEMRNAEGEMQTPTEEAEIAHEVEDKSEENKDVMEAEAEVADMEMERAGTDAQASATVKPEDVDEVKAADAGDTLDDEEQANALELDTLAAQKEARTEETPEVVEEPTDDSKSDFGGDMVGAKSAVPEDANPMDVKIAGAEVQTPTEEAETAHEVEGATDGEIEESGAAIEAEAEVADVGEAGSAEMETGVAETQASAEEGPEDVKEVEAANTGDTVQDDEDPANAVELDSSATQKEAPIEETPEGVDVLQTEAVIADEEENGNANAVNMEIDTAKTHESAQAAVDEYDKTGDEESDTRGSAAESAAVVAGEVEAEAAAAEKAETAASGTQSSAADVETPAQEMRGPIEEIEGAIEGQSEENRGEIKAEAVVAKEEANAVEVPAVPVEQEAPKQKHATPNYYEPCRNDLKVHEVHKDKAHKCARAYEAGSCPGNVNMYCYDTYREGRCCCREADLRIKTSFGSKTKKGTAKCASAYPRP
eukprot:TRINITY_DN547_c0_g1_i1.p1 TRINITY_DN547_c0_g1~~TRINITY_DN547_c0_g1_i1.p1  ORF type:complete len:917 (+),score=251.81 TRINITY_DN547_c0_g1_i1:61-2751(+)